jgi:hypothetical protein
VQGAKAIARPVQGSTASVVPGFEPVVVSREGEKRGSGAAGLVISVYFVAKYPGGGADSPSVMMQAINII